jgi:predicted dehydrogenase
VTLRVGFLGYRFMGRAHANALARLPMFFPDAPDVERHVLVGRDADALAEAADRLGFAETSTDWESAVESVDVFYDLGPNHLHVDPCIHALESGAHVFCEKPLAPDLEGAERMAAAARGSELVTGTAFNYRFVPAIRYAKELLDRGELGDVRQFRGRYLQDWLADADAPWSWRMDEDLAGSGALGDLGAHTVDLARFLVGDVERVSGHLRTFVDERPVEDPGCAADAPERRPVTVDDAYTAQVAFEDGAVGTLEGSRVARGHENDQTIAVHGTEGSLRFSLERLNELHVRLADDRGYRTVLVTDEDDPYVDAWWPPGHVLGWEHAFVHENVEFLTAVEAAESGRDEPGFLPDFEAGLAAQRVLTAIAESDRTGSWERVGDQP